MFNEFLSCLVNGNSCVRKKVQQKRSDVEYTARSRKTRTDDWSAATSSKQNSQSLWTSSETTMTKRGCSTQSAAIDRTRSPSTKRIRVSLDNEDPFWIKEFSFRVSEKDLGCGGWLNGRVVVTVNRLLADIAAAAVGTTRETLPDRITNLCAPSH